MFNKANQVLGTKDICTSFLFSVQRYGLLITLKDRIGQGQAGKRERRGEGKGGEGRGEGKKGEERGGEGRRGRRREDGREEKQARSVV